MKLAVVSLDPKRLESNLETVRRYIHVLSDKPDMVVALGGDGTFLAAERAYPSIPKLLVREQSICNKCDWDNLEEGLRRVLLGNFHIEEFAKIVVKARGKEIEGANDIVIRNALPTEALRFRVFVDGKELGGEFIGDGVVVATAFGSEGYFRSITRKHFEQGVGIAFNNVTRVCEAILLEKWKTITIEITRGEAHVAADNNPDFFLVSVGQRIVIAPSKNKARIVRLV